LVAQTQMPGTRKEEGLTIVAEERRFLILWRVDRDANVFWLALMAIVLHFAVPDVTAAHSARSLGGKE